MKFIVLISSYGESWFTYFFPFQWLAFITDYDHIFTYRQIISKQTDNKQTHRQENGPSSNRETYMDGENF